MQGSLDVNATSVVCPADIQVTTCSCPIYITAQDVPETSAAAETVALTPGTRPWDVHVPLTYGGHCFGFRDRSELVNH